MILILFYVGTGGSIIDAGVFQLEELFECPDEFRSVEDLWLSYIVQAMGWGRRRTTVRPILLAHGKAPASLWSVSGMHVRKNNLQGDFIKNDLLKKRQFFVEVFLEFLRFF